MIPPGGLSKFGGGNNMGQNLKSWQKYVAALSPNNQAAASSYFIGAMCQKLSQKQIGECLKIVKELIRNGI